MTTEMIPAETFAPGEYLRDELAERGWAEGEFASIFGRPVQTVSEILNGKKEITPETAAAIGAALGTSAELWLNLQTSYRLQVVRDSTGQSLEPVRVRSRLRSLVPVRELQRRKWLPETDDVEVLERAVCDLLEIKTLDEEPSLVLAARRSNAQETLTAEQIAWIAYVASVGEMRSTAPLDLEQLASFAAGMTTTLSEPRDLASIAAGLESCGVALVIELPLRNSKLDGVVVWRRDGPVIGLTTRGDRMDSFVFTLLHEIAHLTLNHLSEGRMHVDEDLNPNSTLDHESEANAQAARWIFPTEPILDVDELTPARILEVSEQFRVHPCFLIGRLQREGRLSWSQYRNVIPKVRPYVAFG